MPSQAEILSKLFKESPFSGFDYTTWQPDLQGWGSDHPILLEAIDLFRPRTIIEVGTWKGASAVHMARHLKKCGIPATVVCIDTWLGGVEHFLLKNDPLGYDALGMRHGYPQIYYQFLANVLHSGVQDIIVPLPQTSQIGAKILGTLGIHAEMIYLDGSHEFPDVYLDLILYWQLLKPGGLLIGDDYLPHSLWKGVVQSARKFAAERNLPLYINREKFVLYNGGNPILSGCVPAEERYFDPNSQQYQPLPEGWT